MPCVDDRGDRAGTLGRRLVWRHEGAKSRCWHLAGATGKRPVAEGRRGRQWRSTNRPAVADLEPGLVATAERTARALLQSGPVAQPMVGDDDDVRRRRKNLEQTAT